MTREEAREILNDVSCPCDGRGIRPGSHGVATKCLRCSGKYRTNADVKEARKVLHG